MNNELRLNLPEHQEVVTFENTNEGRKVWFAIAIDNAAYFRCDDILAVNSISTAVKVTSSLNYDPTTAKSNTQNVVHLFDTQIDAKKFIHNNKIYTIMGYRFGAEGEQQMFTTNYNPGFDLDTIQVWDICGSAPINTWMLSFETSLTILDCISNSFVTGYLTDIDE